MAAELPFHTFTSTLFMKRVSKISIAIFVLLCGFGLGNLMAQPVVHGDYPQNDTLVQSSEQKELFEPSVAVSAGTSVSTFGGGQTAVGSYIAPQVSVPVSKKLTMSVGMGYSMMFLNAPSEFGGQTSMSYGSLFVSGTYQVNEKLVVRGTAYKTFSLNQPNQPKSLNSQFFDFSNQGIQLDAEYKVNDKFRIGVSIEYREQNCPSFNQPGFNNFGSTPFRQNSFGTGL